MQRLNFTLDKSTVNLLENLSRKFYSGNKSQTIRAALQSLAAHIGHDGWIIAGYSPVELQGDVSCHTCGTIYRKGDVLFHPVFERGYSPKAMHSLPTETWFDCNRCVGHNVAETLSP
jgi:hypothetical protein